MRSIGGRHANVVTRAAVAAFDEHGLTAWRACQQGNYYFFSAVEPIQKIRDNL
jgi:hypothetical protein